VNANLVHHAILWGKLSHLVRVPNLARVYVCCSDGRVHMYESDTRDDLIGSLVDAAAIHGRWLPVCSQVMGQGWRVGGISAEGDKEYEDALMERLSAPPVKGDDVSQWVDMAHECNCNLSAAAVARLWNRKPLVNLLHVVHERTQVGDGAEVLVPLLTAAQRLVQARALFDEVPQAKKEAAASWRVLETLIKSRAKDCELLAYAASGVLRAMVRFHDATSKSNGEGGVAPKGISRTAAIERFEGANRQAIMDGEFVDVLLERGCRALASVDLETKSPDRLQLGASGALDLLDLIALSHAHSSDVELINRVLARTSDKLPQVMH